MTDADVSLEAGETLLEDPNELIYRQITEHMKTRTGQIGSHAFGAADSDGGKPSYGRSSKVTPQEARDWHTENARSPSLGVWALSVGEVFSVKRTVVDDSATAVPAGKKRAPGHCFIDYRRDSDGDIRTVRAILLRMALKRGEIATTEGARDDGQLELPAS